MKSRQESRAFEGQVVVVTGASAGVGRATALSFAAQGARVGLLARDPQGLEDTRAQIKVRGGTAFCVPVDMADSTAVQAAADTCEAELGPITIWVNNAMATVFSPVSKLTPDMIRRVTEVTYLGYVHGTMAALSAMRHRGKGTIIQVSSALAYRAIPLQAPYCAAKHAIRGFTEALRCELLSEGSAIRLSSVVLPAVNTPQFRWAKTQMKTCPRPVAPVYEPEAAADAILHAARCQGREYFLGYQTPLLIMGNTLMPDALDHYLSRNAIEGQDTGEPVRPNRPDNLFAPVPGEHHTRGDFSREARSDALLLPAAMARALGLAALLAVGAVLSAGLGKRR